MRGTGEVILPGVMCLTGLGLLLEVVLGHEPFIILTRTGLVLFASGGLAVAFVVVWRGWALRSARRARAAQVPKPAPAARGAAPAPERAPVKAGR
jgi:hypothetical protein